MNKFVNAVLSLEPFFISRLTNDRRILKQNLEMLEFYNIWDLLLNENFNPIRLKNTLDQNGRIYKYDKLARQGL